jgi:hypothetical protein
MVARYPNNTAIEKGINYIIAKKNPIAIGNKRVFRVLLSKR